MIATQQEVRFTASPPIRLPEPLGANGTMLLAACDAASAAVIVVAGALSGHGRSCTLAVTIVLVVSFVLGRYRLSYAQQPIDESYSVAAAALVAALLLAALIVPFEVQWIPAYAALLLWSAAAARVAVLLTARRRGEERPAIARVSRVPSTSAYRLRNPALRALMNALDFAAAAAMSLALLPLMAFCALAVWIGDGGPVLFTQERTGIDGRPFTMLKFRTMRADADDSWARPADERITHAGRWLRRTSLDELPQLWNVVRGEMSLVGPRPEMTQYSAHFTETIPAYNERHAIKPGITGWAQIHYRRNFPPEAAAEVTGYDLFYVANYSVSLYLYCLVKTACEVFTHRAV